MVIPIVAVALGTVLQSLEERLEEEWRPTKEQHFWDWLEYSEESLRAKETRYRPDSSEKQQIDNGVKNLPGVKIIYVYIIIMSRY